MSRGRNSSREDVREQVRVVTSVNLTSFSRQCNTNNQLQLQVLRALIKYTHDSYGHSHCSISQTGRLGCQAGSHHIATLH